MVFLRLLIKCTQNISLHAFPVKVVSRAIGDSSYPRGNSNAECELSVGIKFSTGFVSSTFLSVETPYENHQSVGNSPSTILLP